MTGKQGQSTFFVAVLVSAALLAGCAGGPTPPDWQLNARAALQGFEKHYLEGNTKLAELEFMRAKDEIRATGRADLVARVELVRCAARTASLEIDNCPGFESLRRDAGAEELAYADYLAGKGWHAVSEDPLSRLVAAGVAFRSGSVTPAQIGAAIELASAQGWRRPLLAWLEVEAKRAEAAGDRAAVERLRRRIGLVAGPRS
ncbi:MAG: hypothetical protein FJY43_01785 [Betaproteobacteria bacterium]|nr:hypothetical protein [Betaproteobacteria bacterium]